MSDTEIGALRAKLASRVRSDDYRQRRKDFDTGFSQYGIARDVTIEPVTANGVRAEWTSTPRDDRDAALLYVHGGGYVIGSLDSHRHLVGEAGRAAKAWALALDYRLAPEHPFPAAVEDAVSGYRYLLSRGIRPGRIAIAGDSAGGGLVVAAMLAIREAGLPQPACGWCISPWVDMEGIGEIDVGKAEADPMVQKAGLLEMAEPLSRRRRPALATGGADLCRPSRSGAVADPGRRGGDVARRCDPVGQGRRCRRCARRSAGLAGDGPCLAPLSPRAQSRPAGDRSRRSLCPRHDGGIIEPLISCLTPEKRCEQGARRGRRGAGACHDLLFDLGEAGATAGAARN